MRSTMMDFPLTVRHIFEHGRTTYGDSEVVTNAADGVRRITFGALADRADQLAAGLRRLGVEPGDRVATFAWNTQEHQEAYFAIPGMAAVMHTINIRLSAEQIRYIIGHAEDSVLLADASLAPVLAPVLAAGGDELKTLRHLIVFGEGDRSGLPEHIDYEELLAAERPGYPWPEIEETAAAAMCYTSGTTDLPKGVVYSHRSTFLHPGGMKILGTPIDISRISCDTYVAAGMTDHITPWHTSYRSTQMVSGHSQFVLCSSGHIQTVVADPKHRGLGYFVNPETPPDAEQWLAGAQRHEGSWWEHWAGWLADRSGAQVAAPQPLGSPRFPAIEPAPGTYVTQ